MNRLLLASAFVCCVAPTFASVTLRFDGTGLGQNIDYVYNGDARSGFAGQLKFRDLTANKDTVLFCVDLDHFITGGQTYSTNTMPTLGDATYGKPGSVFANSYAGVNSNDKATALQIAIWASRYNGNLSTNSGTFRLKWSWYNSNQSIIDLAKQMVALGDANPKNAIYYGPDPKGSGQGQLGPVPEPFTMLALGAGIAGLACKRRRKS